MNPRIITIAAVATCATLLAACAPASDDSEYPAKRVELIVPFASGGTSDTLARALAQELDGEDSLDQQVQVVNRPGASAAIGLEELAKSDPDGYTIALTGNASLTAVPQLNDTEFTVESFDPIMQITSGTPVLAVRADASWKTGQQFVQEAKDNPGTLRVAVAGAHTIGDLARASLESSSGASLESVPFESDGPAMTTLLGNNVSAHLAASAAVVSPQVDAGKVRVLMTFGTERDPAFPDVPTAKELGFDVVTPANIVVLAPKGLPESVRSTLASAVSTAVQTTTFTELANKSGYTVTTVPGPETQDLLAAESEDFEEVLR